MRTLIFIHGAFGAAKDLIPLSTMCRGVNVKLINLPFHGSEAGPAFNYQSLRDALSVKLQAEKDYSIFGYSMGGYLALDLMANGEIEPHGLTTYGTRFLWNQDTVQRIEGVMNPESLATNLPAYVEELETMHGEDWKELIKSSLVMMNDLIRSPLRTELMRTITTPTKFYIGDKDILTNLNETESIASQLKAGNFEVVSGEHDIKKLPTSSLQKIAHFLSLQNA